MRTNNFNTEVQSTKHQYTSTNLSSEIAIEQRVNTLTTQSAKVAYLLELIHTTYTNQAHYRNEKKLIQKIADKLTISPQLLKKIEFWVFLHDNNASSRKNIKH